RLHVAPAHAVDPPPLDPPRQGIPVLLVVFDNQNFRHRYLRSLAGAPALLLSTGGSSSSGLRPAFRLRPVCWATTRFTSASNSSRLYIPFCRTFSTWPFKRRRSSLVRSLEVNTTTGIDRQAWLRRNSARNSKPSIS